MTASKKAKELGCKSLAQVARVTGQSKETLTNWFTSRPVVFEACCLYVARRKMTDETQEVECPKCGVKCRDFTPEADFIGWNGHCVRCDMEMNDE